MLHDTNDRGGEGYKTSVIDIEWKVYFHRSGCHMVSISGEGEGYTKASIMGFVGMEIAFWWEVVARYGTQDREGECPLMGTKCM